MNNKEIFELIDYFENSGLSELEIEVEDRKLHMKKENRESLHEVDLSASALTAAAAAAGHAAVTGNPVFSGNTAVSAAIPLDTLPYQKDGKNKNPEDGTVEFVRSPIVGVYYKAPSPEEPDFVSIGDKVLKGQTLCIIEAMKVMNELKAPCDGIVKGIYGIDGELAEYDEVLFEVKKC